MAAVTFNRLERQVNRREPTTLMINYSRKLRILTGYRVAPEVELGHLSSPFSSVNLVSPAISVTGQVAFRKTIDMPYVEWVSEWANGLPFPSSSPH